MSGHNPSDRLDLRDLAQRYAAALDRRDVDGFVALYTPDATVAVFEHGQEDPTLEYHGSRELATVMDLVTIYSGTFHIVANHFCEIDGDQATGYTYCVARHLVEAPDGSTDIEMLIRYDDAYVRTSDGWRFRRRDIRRQWTVERAAERGSVPRTASDL